MKDFLTKLFFTFFLIYILKISVEFFGINLGLELNFLSIPLSVLASILFCYFIGSFLTGRFNLKEKLIVFFNKIWSYRPAKYIFMPLFLFLAGIILSVLVTVSENDTWTVLVKKHSNQAFAAYQFNELLPGKVASVVFTADENNLGSTAVKFNTYGRINDDILEFRLKEEKKTDWIYVNQYKTDQFQDGRFFPFSFPVISDSIGKTYLFEIESLRGSEGNAVSLSKKTPIIESRYKFSSGQLLSDPIVLLRFYLKKIFYQLKDFRFWLASIIYLVPFFGYLYFLKFNKTLFSKFLAVKNYFLISLAGLILIEIIIQAQRLAGEYLGRPINSGTYLQTTAGIFLSVTISLGVITGIIAENNQKPTGY